MLKRLSLLVPLLVITLLVCGGVSSSAMTPAALAASGVSADSGVDNEGVSVPADATPQQLRDIMAAMSDEQVRSLLISELEKNVVPAPTGDEKTGAAGLIVKAKSFVRKVKERLAYLFSGAAQAPRLLPDTFRKTLSGDGMHPPGHLALGLLVITVMWFVSRWGVARWLRDIRVKIEDVGDDAHLLLKIGRLLIRACFDVFAVATVTLVSLIPYLLVFDEPEKGRPVIFAWLTAMVVVEVVRLVARFILSPKVPAIRFLPLKDDSAKIIYAWVVRIAWVIAMGVLAASLVRMTHGSELVYLLILAITGFVVAFMFSLLALWHKKRVADTILSHAEPGSIQYIMAGYWHVGVILYAFGFWFCWVVALLVFGETAVRAGVLTLLLVPTYLLLDWATQRLVRFAVDMADTHAADPAQNGEGSAPPTITKFQNFLSRSFRALVLAGAVFLLLDIWGLDIRIGRATVNAGIDTLLTLVVAYIFWLFVSNYIEGKLKANQPEGQTDSGEGGGGPGGDRFSTLLQLVKKFIFAAVSVVTVLIILSSLGVDIGPLIAGASVFGIAIGFGAQTLVKDIISGIFFLMDDAFRVGDYIIVGSARGTVEEISVRSFKLRHHLGPLYTVPFGSIKEIQNMSRDWAIMKLKYLVPFDTDIHKVKKIIKKINKEIRAVPELNEFMLDDIKSQGVKAMQEYGMLMRVKFMTKPGGQFTLRKLVLAKMRKEFAAAGIEFAKPRVSVSLPGETELTPEEEATVAAAAAKAAEPKEPAGQKGHGQK